MSSSSKKACEFFLPFIHSCSVLIMSDSTTTIFCINKQEGAKSASLCTEAVNLWNWCPTNQITLSAAYLLGKQNVLADSQSRHFAIDHEWELHNSVLHNISMQWGTLTRDLFASQTNRKCAFYCSRGALNYHPQRNALLCSWSDELKYAFPPLPLLPWMCRTRSNKTGRRSSWSAPSVPYISFLNLLFTLSRPPITILHFPTSWSSANTLIHTPPPQGTVFGFRMGIVFWMGMLLGNVGHSFS